MNTYLANRQNLLIKIKNIFYFLRKTIIRQDFLIILICLVGIILRLVLVFNFAVFEGDESRDLLIARHIAFYNEPRLLGHDASGLPGLFYPPYYFYFLSFITRLFDNPQAIYIIIALLSGVSVYFLYITIKQSFNKRIGLYSVIIYTFLPVTINSANLWSCNVGLSFFIISLYFLASFLNTKKIRHALVFIVLYIFSSFTAYEFIMFLPLFIILMLYTVRSNHKTFLLLTITWMILILVNLFPVINQYTQPNADKIEIPINQEFFIKNSLNIKELIYNSLSHGSNSSKFLLFSEIISLCFIIKLLLAGDIKKNKNLIMLFLAFHYGIVIASFKKDVLSYQLLALWPIAITLLVAQIDYLFNRYKIFMVLAIIYIIILIGNPSWKYINNLFISFSYQSETNELIQYNLVANKILFSLRDNTNPFVYFIKVDDKYHDPFNKSEIYYFLERNSNRKYITVGKTSRYWSSNIFNKKTNEIFLVCRDDENIEDTKTQCFNYFFQNFQPLAKINKRQIIFNQRNLVVYQIKLNNYISYEL